ncbi:MAG: YggS family pyridoxal phosphate-dependent enzyme [Rhodospirillales bacterium]|nr:YggS family pyridoxal phosphate-dependent enzyme [Rhodospirillales bacterium]
MSDPASNLAMVQADIRKAAEASGRNPKTVNLVAVSKFHDAPSIIPVLEAGHRLFGENRVQEAAGKWPALRDSYTGIALHLIGPLQSNKVKEAVATFDVIETVDRMKIARALATEFERCGRQLPCYVQVNTGEEPQKAGVPPAEVDAFVKTCRTELGLDIQGLMCIPPVDEEPALHFALLAKIAERNGLAVKSMGMSADYQTAITFGATHVRVGTAIFGHRPEQ